MLTSFYTTISAFRLIAAENCIETLCYCLFWSVFIPGTMQRTAAMPVRYTFHLKTNGPSNSSVPACDVLAGPLITSNPAETGTVSQLVSERTTYNFLIKQNGRLENKCCVVVLKD